jgi:hypothetical protein
VDAFDLDVFEVRPVRGLIAEAMGQIDEFQPHAVFQIFFEHHAANFFRHGILPLDCPALRRGISDDEPRSGGGGFHMSF